MNQTQMENWLQDLSQTTQELRDHIARYGINEYDKTRNAWGDVMAMAEDSIDQMLFIIRSDEERFVHDVAPRRDPNAEHRLTARELI